MCKTFYLEMFKKLSWYKVHANIIATGATTVVVTIYLGRIKNNRNNKYNNR